MRFHVKRLALVALLAAAPLWASGERVVVPNAAVELVGRLYKPTGEGPFPAVVMLHGCNGLWGSDGEPTKHYAWWAKHFQERGFMALLLDSFGPRGEKEICTQGIRKIHPSRERAGDAHAASRWLKARPDVVTESIHLLGWSNGGMSVLQAVRDGSAGRDAAASFRSAVAFYPGCKDLVERDYATRIPLLIQAGAADDWTPARHCEAVVAAASKKGGRVEIDVYEGAHHAFDGMGARVRHRGDVRNPSSPSGWGAHVGPDPVARDKSRIRATEFIEAHR